MTTFLNSWGFPVDSKINSVLNLSNIGCQHPKSCILLCRAVSIFFTFLSFFGNVWVTTPCCLLLYRTMYGWSSGGLDWACVGLGGNLAWQQPKISAEYLEVHPLADVTPLPPLILTSLFGPRIVFPEVIVAIVLCSDVELGLWKSSDLGVSGMYGSLVPDRYHQQQQVCNGKSRGVNCMSRPRGAQIQTSGDSCLVGNLALRHQPYPFSFARALQHHIQAQLFKFSQQPHGRTTPLPKVGCPR